MKLTRYPSIEDSLAIGSTCSQAIFIDWPFTFLAIILGARSGAGEVKTKQS